MEGWKIINKGFIQNLVPSLGMFKDSWWLWYLALEVIKNCYSNINTFKSLLFFKCNNNKWNSPIVPLIFPFKAGSLSGDLTRPCVHCIWCKPGRRLRGQKKINFSVFSGHNPILERRSTVLLLLLLLLLLLCHAQATPPGFWNGLDWRALVED